MSNIPASSFDRDFKFHRLLGKGNYASVSEVYHLIDKKKYAVKQILTQSTEEMAQAMNEIEVLKSLEDENITKIFYHYLRAMRKNGNHELGIIMELCETTLTETIKQRKKRRVPFSCGQLLHFLYSVIPFFSKMQSRGYLHRDIKPENILMNQGKGCYDYRVADFGFAIKINSYSSRNIAGTMEYASPKLVVKFKNQKLSVSGQTYKDDVYSLGKTLAEMMMLEIGQPLTTAKIGQCREKYGKELGYILQKMVAENESQRADFISLDNFMNQDRNIERPVKLSNSRTTSKSKGRSSLNSKKSYKDNDSVTTMTTEHRRDLNTKSKYEQVLKTEVKMENALDQMLKIKTEPGKASVPSNEIKSKGWRQNTLKMRQKILCMAICDHILFMGLYNKIGMMLIQSEKVILLSSNSQMRKITCLSVSQDQETLFVGSTNSKIYCIPIVQLNKLILNNQKSFKLNNTLQIPLARVIYRQIKVELPALCLFPLPGNSTCKEVSMIVGHSTGEVSFISCNAVERKMFFMSEPFTCIKLHQGQLYGGSFSGLFKRQSADLLGIFQDSNTPIEKKRSEGFRLTVPFSFKCNSPIVNFQIISESKVNLSIQNENNRYLAIVAEHEGFIHIVSHSMRCEKTIRVAQTEMFACHLSLDPAHKYGARGLFIDKAGVLTNEKEEVVRKTGEEKLTCLAANQENIFIGGQFSDKLLMLGQEEDTIDLE